MFSILCNNHFSIWLFMFFWASILTPLSVRISERYGILDCPGGRKCHKGIIPRGGGLVVESGVILLSLASGALGRSFAPIITGSCLVFLIGYFDDIKSLSPKIRLLTHLISSFFVVCFVEVDFLSKIILIFWITGMINAFNLIDGMNGLAISLASLTTLVALSHRGGLWWSGLLGLCLGILIWNFPKAYTFLGDGGSTLLGYLCASILVYDFGFSFISLSPYRLILFLIFFGGVPVFDTLIAMARRMSKFSSPFEPDRGHFHHVLLDKGLSEGKVILFLGFMHFLSVIAAFWIIGVSFGFM